MQSKQLNLTYALKDDKSVHISEVERGLACGCSCPACGTTLIARKGKKMAHHFAHQSSHECEYGYESSLHLMAKDILSKAKTMIIPGVIIQFPDSYKKCIFLNEAKEIVIDHVELEQRFGDIIPDVVVYLEGKPFFVEIFVTHRIDDKKFDKIRSLGISTMEIDLSYTNRSITVEELAYILTSKGKPVIEQYDKYWVYNSYADKYLQKFYDVSDELTIKTRGFIKHVDGCPICVHSYCGKPYANLIDDCLACPYCIKASIDSGILCSGKKRISSIEDLERGYGIEPYSIATTEPVIKNIYVSARDQWDALFKQAEHYNMEH